jgi:thiamine-monophosphate kinase
MNEKEIIELFAARLGLQRKRMGLDDIAIINAGSEILAFKCDMLVESTDVPKGMEPWQVARKSIVSCASDLASKGIAPYVALVSLGIPKGYPSSHIEGLADGFKAASGEFGVRIVGGDTNECSELVIDCSMIGRAGRRDRKIPSRQGARPGDFVVVSGAFGYASSGLKILINGAKASGQFRKKAVESVLMPAPRQKFGIAMAKYFSSSMDSSDGLSTCLYELARASKVEILIDSEKVPIPAGLEEFARENGLDTGTLVFHGGEEFEIVATIPQARMEEARRQAKKMNLNLYAIGRVVKKRGMGPVVVKTGSTRRQLEDRGYMHLG